MSDNIQYSENNDKNILVENNHYYEVKFHNNQNIIFNLFLLFKYLKKYFDLNVNNEISQTCLKKNPTIYTYIYQNKIILNLLDIQIYADIWNRLSNILFIPIEKVCLINYSRNNNISDSLDTLLSLIKLESFIHCEYLEKGLKPETFDMTYLEAFQEIFLSLNRNLIHEKFNEYLEQLDSDANCDCNKSLIMLSNIIFNCPQFMNNKRTQYLKNKYISLKHPIISETEFIYNFIDCDIIFDIYLRVLKNNLLKIEQLLLCRSKDPYNKFFGKNNLPKDIFGYIIYLIFKLELPIID